MEAIDILNVIEFDVAPQIPDVFSVKLDCLFSISNRLINEEFPVISLQSSNKSVITLEAARISSSGSK